jgi:hypothetical protein
LPTTISIWLLIYIANAGNHIFVNLLHCVASILCGETATVLFGRAAIITHGDV